MKILNLNFALLSENKLCCRNMWIVSIVVCMLWASVPHVRGSNDEEWLQETGQCGDAECASKLSLCGWYEHEVAVFESKN